jgi:uncharacterized membrane protein HdeD (DUF308 family)
MEKGLLIPDSECQSRQWHRFAQLGIALVILGTLAATIDSSVPVMVFGWILGLSGVLEIIHAFQVQRSVGFFLHLIPGITSVPVGLLVATRSDFGAVAWTLLFACLFTVIGPYRTITAYSLRFHAFIRNRTLGGMALVGRVVLWFQRRLVLNPARLVNHHARSWPA